MTTRAEERRAAERENARSYAVAALVLSVSTAALLILSLLLGATWPIFAAVPAGIGGIWYGLAALLVAPR